MLVHLQSCILQMYPNNKLIHQQASRVNKPVFLGACQHFLVLWVSWACVWGQELQGLRPLRIQLNDVTLELGSASIS
jgi:hypothetical protein